MTEAQAAVGLDRLPWLADEPRPRTKGSARELLGWAAAATLLIAGGSYWLGTQSADRDALDTYEAPAPPRPQATVKLPEVRPAPAPPPVEIAPAREVEPAPAPTVSLPEPRVEKRVRPKKRAVLKRESPSRARLEEAVKRQTKTRTTEPVASPAVSAAAARPKPLTLWPSRTSKGASGRLVQIGAFGSRQQAKLGWRRMQRSYPAVGRLPAVVVEARNSRGKRYYRFQIGTTSQAHSEVLCQRMRRIRYSCAVVGLPWKAKVER